MNSKEQYKENCYICGHFGKVVQGYPGINRCECWKKWLEPKNEKQLDCQKLIFNKKKGEFP